MDEVRDRAIDGQRSDRKPLPVRDLVVQAGLELLEDRGLSLTLTSISYAKVFAYLEDNYDVRVTRGSVHERIWDSQQAFRKDVLAESVRFFERSRISEAIVHRATNADDVERFARHFGSRLYPKVLASRSFSQFQLVKSLSARFDESLATDALHELMNNRANASLVTSQASFPAFLHALQLQPASAKGLSMDQTSDLFAGIIVGLTEGANMNHHAGVLDTTAPIEFGAVPADAEDSWRMISIGTLGLMGFLLEPSPPSAASAAPSAEAADDRERPDPVGDLATATSDRRPREQLKQLVLAGAIEVLLQEGVELQTEPLGYAAVFAHIKERHGITVNRASVHRRFWDSNDDFRAEVLSRSLETYRPSLEEVLDRIEEMPAVLADDGSVDREQTKSNVIRRLTAWPRPDSPDHVARRRLLQIKAALIDVDESAARAGLRAAVKGLEEARMRRTMATVQSEILDLGFRPRPDNGLSSAKALELFCTLTITTMTGLALNGLAGIDATVRPVALASQPPDDERVGMLPAEIASHAFFELLYTEV